MMDSIAACKINLLEIVISNVGAEKLRWLYSDYLRRIIELNNVQLETMLSAFFEPHLQFVLKSGI